MTTATYTGAPPTLADDLQALYLDTKAKVGDSDLAHIRHVAAYGKAINARRIELLREGGPRNVGRAVVLESLYRLLQFSELGHNVIHGSYDHLPNAGEFHSERYDWDFNLDIRDWKVMHHEGHHPHTNIVGKDHDLGYGYLRGQAGQDWYAHHVAQFALIAAATPLIPQIAPFLVSDLGRRVRGKNFLDLPRLGTAARIAVRDTVRRVVSEPVAARSGFASALAGNYFGGIAGYLSVLALVAIEHHAPNVEVFADPGPDETPNAYFERQIRATTNFLRDRRLDGFLERILHEEVPFENRPNFHIFYGGLDTHIEHHLFPDLPPNRQREIAPAVRDIVVRHGMPYHELLIADVLPTAAKVLGTLSLPVGEREDRHPLRLLTQPFSLARRLGFGATYRALPDAPYLDKPRLFNVPVKVLSARPVADGQALSVRLQRPHGWDDVSWDAGAIVSLRVTVDDQVLVRQYSLVRDSNDADVMEICIKRVADGRVSNRLHEELRAGRYVTLVGVPTSTGGLTMEQAPEKTLLIAGGVGITPIISLIRKIAREEPGADAVLLYFNRNEQSIIFRNELRALARRSGVTVHFFTNEESARESIITGGISQDLIRNFVPDVADREAYVCAPPAVIDLARGFLTELGLRATAFHTESFTPPALERPEDDGRRFTVRFRRSERSVQIGSSTTLLEAAGKAGIAIPTGCERGLCRACVTPKLSGTTQLEVDGTPQSRVTVCNSLACSDIELDA